MMMRYIKVLFLACLLVVSTTNLHAADREYTISQVAAQLKDSGAEILSAEVKQERGGKVYRFKIKEKGRIRVVVMRPDGSRVR
jgi:outer membrane lipoprotein-sorting protein